MEQEDPAYLLDSLGPALRRMARPHNQLGLDPLDVCARILHDAVVAFLEEKTHSIDALIAEVCEAIERLKELRTALISAAVTGKIDVREEVA